MLTFTNIPSDLEDIKSGASQQFDLETLWSKVTPPAIGTKGKQTRSVDKLYKKNVIVNEISEVHQ